MAVGRVLLIRHGETAWSQVGKHTGTTDLELTEHGRQQAAGLAGQLPTLLSGDAAFVLCSPLLRARQTADLAGLTPYLLEPDLVEWNYGDYEGLTSGEIRQSSPGWSVWRSLCPGGETSEQVRLRCDRDAQPLHPSPRWRRSLPILLRRRARLRT